MDDGLCQAIRRGLRSPGRGSLPLLSADFYGRVSAPRSSWCGLGAARVPSLLARPRCTACGQPCGHRHIWTESIRRKARARGFQHPRRKPTRLDTSGVDLARGRRRSSSPTRPRWLTTSKPISLHEGLAIVEVPDDFTRNQIEGRLRGQLEDALSAVYGGEIRLVVTREPGGARPRRMSTSNRLIDKTTCRQIEPLAAVLPLTPSNHFGIGLADPDELPGLRPSSRASRPPPSRDGPRGPAQPEVHLRDLRHRLVQPVPARRRGRGLRGAGQGLQPAARLRRLRAGQDPPAARDRSLRAQPLHRRPGALRVERGVHQRVHQRDPRRPAGPVQAPLPRRRRPADRRHPVPGGQDPDPGGVLPHLQHAPQRQQADRADLRPRARSGSRRSRTGCATGSSGA